MRRKGIVLVKRKTIGGMGGMARRPFPVRPNVIWRAIIKLREINEAYREDVEIDEEVLRKH